MTKKIILYALVGLSILTALASAIACFVLKPERPWMAFFVACCGAMLVLNLLAAAFFIHKNFRPPGDK
jgi:uncharacterized membrane protein YeaQ/YmgE (transglycosylase-associated protein family)